MTADTLPPRLAQVLADLQAEVGNSIAGALIMTAAIDPLAPMPTLSLCGGLVFVSVIGDDLEVWTPRPLTNGTGRTILITAAPEQARLIAIDALGAIAKRPEWIAAVRAASQFGDPAAAEASDPGAALFYALTVAKSRGAFGGHLGRPEPDSVMITDQTGRLQVKAYERAAGSLADGLGRYGVMIITRRGDGRQVVSLSGFEQTAAGAARRAILAWVDLVITAGG